MEHVVFYPGAEGAPAFKRVGSLEDAVRLVEHLRNVEGVADVSVHALTEVPMAFRAYYRVEVPTSAPEQVASTAAEAPVAVVPVQDHVAPDLAPHAAPVEAAAVEATPVSAAPFMPSAEAAAAPAIVDPTVEATEQPAPPASAEPAFAGAESNGQSPSNGHHEVTGLGFFAS